MLCALVDGFPAGCSGKPSKHDRTRPATATRLAPARYAAPKDLPRNQRKRRQKTRGLRHRRAHRGVRDLRRIGGLPPAPYTEIDNASSRCRVRQGLSRPGHERMRHAGARPGAAQRRWRTAKPEPERPPKASGPSPPRFARTLSPFHGESERKQASALSSHLLVGVDHRLAVGAGLLQPVRGELLADLLEAGRELRARRLRPSCPWP